MKAGDVRNRWEIACVNSFNYCNLYEITSQSSLGEKDDEK
jgi:hypothetical protein